MHEPIDAAPLTRHRIDELCGALVVRQLSRNRREVLVGKIGVRDRTRHPNDPRVRLEESVRNGRSQPTLGACNKYDFVVEVHALVEHGYSATSRISPTPPLAFTWMVTGSCSWSLFTQ